MRRFPIWLSFTFVAVVLGPLLFGPGAAAARKPPVPATPPLEGTMAGEFALQAGDLNNAARWYLEAAKSTDDPGLAERATRIALLANDDARAAEPNFKR